MPMGAGASVQASSPASTLLAAAFLPLVVKFDRHGLLLIPDDLALAAIFAATGMQRSGFPTAHDLARWHRRYPMLSGDQPYSGLRGRKAPWLLPACWTSTNRFS